MISPEDSISMNGPLVRLSDVAETIVAGYLFRVLTYMEERDMPPAVGAYFKVVPARAAVDPEAETVVFQPAFRVLITLSGPIAGIGELVTEEAANTPGNVLIMPNVELVDDTSEDALRAGSWRKVLLPGFATPSPGTEQLTLSR